MSLQIIVIDFNSYFASVEQQVNPKLRDQPVGVVPVVAETTCCIAASHEAKQWGVKTGTLVTEARQRCPNIIFVPARHDLYVKFHHAAIEIIDTILPVSKVMSIDEMACELPVRWRHPDAAREKAAQIKTALESGLGQCLKTSIGIAPNLFLAKTASNLQKPDGLVILQHSDLPGPLLKLPINALTGIGPGMAIRLNQYGVQSMQDLWKISSDELGKMWGSIEGQHFHAKLHGLETPSLNSQRSTLSHSHVLPPRLRNAQGAYGVLNRLTQKAAMRLRKIELLAGTLSVHIKFTERDSRGRRLVWKKEVSLPHTQHTVNFIRALDHLWSSLPSPHPTPSAVGMALFDLKEAQYQNGSLFDPGHRQDALYQTLDDLNIRYGKHTVFFAGAHAALEEAPMRIAFNHIPDLQTEA
ncbi:Y-family DNA polymerase [Ampullimonas aquatilis]|uniref:Y-family DNA polymerase n=1 Tax=Ampullimonas aquatilis TaxID=1341549 RepID=UPI003C7401F4